ncbi:MAG: chromosome segregation protein SMC, partial [Eubacteriales bacterium]
MYLKRIELTGFKSFPDKYEIIMDNKITGIVGPNGSGKSNICDAILWVLGEQNARNLRGSKMEDIIFNGTQTRKQKSYCEVVLIFDNMDGRLMADYSEIQISRKMYRSGESEYSLNGTSCRLKDILNLFRDTGIGREGYSIVGQGKIDEILNEKAVSRRKVFEEAAGVMKYRVSKEETERKLLRTEENLIRVNDVIEELSIHLEPIKIQCENAKKYLALKEEEKTLEINLFLKEYENGNDRIERLKKEVSGIEDETNEMSLNLGVTKDSYENAVLNLTDIDERISELNEKISSFKAKEENLTGKVLLFTEKKENINSQINRLNLEIQKNVSNIADVTQGIKDEYLAISEIEEKLNDLSLNIEELNSKINNLRENNGGIDAELVKTEIIKLMNQLSEVKSALAADDAKKNAIDTRNEELKKALDSVSNQLIQTQKLTDEQNEEKIKIQTQKTDIVKQLENVLSDIKKEEDTIARAKQELSEKLRKLDQLSSQIKMLKDLNDSFEGYHESVKSLLKAAESRNDISEKIISSVVSAIKVDEEYEIAIETALGAAAQNIVVKDEYGAKYLIEFLRKNNMGRVSFLPLKTLKARYLSSEERRFLKDDGVIGIASELIEIKEESKVAIDFLLARTVLVKDIDSAISVMKRCGSFRAVTLKGDVFNPSGVITGGSVHKKTFNLLSRERILTETQKTYGSLYDETQSLNLNIRTSEIALTGRKQKRSELLDSNHAYEVKLSAMEQKAESLFSKLEDLGKDSERISSEISENEDTKLKINSSIEKGSIKRNAVQKLIGDKEESLKSLEKISAQAEFELDKLKEELNLFKVQESSLKTDKQARETAVLRLKSQIKDLENENKNKADEIEKFKENLNEAGNLIFGAEEELKEVKISSGKANEEFNSALSIKEKLNEDIKSQIDKRTGIEDRLNDISDRKNKAEVSIARTETNLENAQNRIWDEYMLTYANALEFKQDINISESQRRLSSIKEEICEMGPINPNAPKDYARSSERYEFLKEQSADLSRAKEDLNKVICELVKYMEENFRDRFKIINEYFKESFSALFNGGHAELILLDEGNIME